MEQQDNRFIRTEMLLGKNSTATLAKSSVAVFGIGGVGGHVVETLARSGIGKFLLVDNDIVGFSNINRQIVALSSTLNQAKVEVMKKRIEDINPCAKVETKKMFYLPENADSIDLKKYDYVVDCIDTVTAKIELARRCEEQQVKIISCLGTGNKTDPTKFEITDVFNTNICPLAKVMRNELKKRGVKALEVLYSTASNVRASDEFVEENENTNKRQTPASCPFVPSVAGILIARHVVLKLLNF